MTITTVTSRKLLPTTLAVALAGLLMVNYQRQLIIQR